MKKILLIAPSLHQGGLEKVCSVTARLLQPYFDVRIAIFDSRDIAYDIKGIPVADLRLPSRSSKLCKIVNIIKRGLKLRALMRKEHIDIAYSFGPTANLANIASGIKVTRWLGIRGNMDLDSPTQVRLFCRFADRVICCSHAHRHIIQDEYRCNKVYTLHNPFDVQEVHMLSEQGKAELPWNEGRILISMGREDPIKGFWHLLKSFSLVHDKLPDTKLVIVGKGEFQAYKKLASELGIEEDVYFTGLKKNPYPYLKKGCLDVLTAYCEGFPNAMVEAMAMGLPVIAADCMTGPREILEDQYGILVPDLCHEEDFDPHNITAEEHNLAQEVVALLEDPDKLEHYGQMALERAAKYTTESYVEQIREWAQ